MNKILRKIIQFFIVTEPLPCDSCINRKCTHTPSICNDCIDYNEYEEDVSHETLKGKRNV